MTKNSENNFTILLELFGQVIINGEIHHFTNAVPSRYTYICTRGRVLIRAAIFPKRDQVPACPVALSGVE